LQADLKVGDIIRSVSCFGVYQPLIDQLKDIGYPEGGTGNRLLVCPYDWRQDLEKLAGQFAFTLGELTKTMTSITIVAHSMGGLIARLALEGGKHDGDAWFPKIKSFISLATPHLGAPLALARILGMDSSLGISGPDFREIASDRRYPSGYQLLPPPREASLGTSPA
jgi:pimeloyl-ACP methyl ester carboxylesterase